MMQRKKGIRFLLTDLVRFHDPLLTIDIKDNVYNNFILIKQ